MIQQSVLGARVCIVQLLRVTRLNEWICKHHVHIRSKADWYLTRIQPLLPCKKIAGAELASAITSKSACKCFIQGRTQGTIEQFNLRAVGVVPAPRMLDWYQILTKAWLSRWTVVDWDGVWDGPGMALGVADRICRPLCRSLPKLLLANGSQRRQPGRADWYDSNELWLSRHVKTFAGAAGCASVLISFRFIGSAPEVLTTASIAPTNQEGTYRLQLHRSASRQLSGKVKMHTQKQVLRQFTLAFHRMKPLWSLHGILVVPSTGKEYFE